MLNSDKRRKRYRVGFLLLPTFSLIGFSSAADALNLANYVAEEKLFEICTIGNPAGQVESFNGTVVMAEYGLDAHKPLDMVVVCCCSVAQADLEDPKVLSWLRKRFIEGATIGAMSTGSLVLAHAGLLEGRKATIHWEYIQAFQELFPNVQVSQEVFQSDGRVFTSAGGSSVVDYFLKLVESMHGPKLAAETANMLVHHPIQHDTREPLSSGSNRSALKNVIIKDAIEIMEENVEDPLRIFEIADMLSLSCRQMERYFLKFLSTTPQLYYRGIRLRGARSYLRSTDLAIGEIAIAFGFNTPSYFAKCYAEEFGHSPQAELSVGTEVVARIRTSG